MDLNPTKFCAACQQDLPVSAFWKNKARKDGLQTYCKTCFAPQAQETAERFRKAHPERHLAYQRKYYKRNTEYVLSYVRLWRLRNPKRVAEYNKINGPRWYAKNKARALATNRLYVERNRAKFRSWWRNKSGRRRAQAFSTMIGPVDYTTIYHRDKGICHICLNPVPKSRLHYDHVIPLSKGGPHTEENIKVSHARCNLKKGARI